MGVEDRGGCGVGWVGVGGVRDRGGERRGGGEGGVETRGRRARRYRGLHRGPSLRARSSRPRCKSCACFTVSGFRFQVSGFGLRASGWGGVSGAAGNKCFVAEVVKFVPRGREGGDDVREFPSLQIFVSVSGSVSLLKHGAEPRGQVV